MITASGCKALRTHVYIFSRLFFIKRNGFCEIKMRIQLRALQDKKAATRNQKTINKNPADRYLRVYPKYHSQKVHIHLAAKTR